MPKSAESFGKHMKLLNSLLESLYHITFLPATYVRSGFSASSPAFGIITVFYFSCSHMNSNSLLCFYHINHLINNST